LKGKPNTRQTGSAGEMMIHEALLYSSRFSVEDVSVRAVPVAMDQIDFFVFIKAGKEEIVLSQSISL
jgi:hypothetical protein